MPPKASTKKAQPKTTVKEEGDSSNTSSKKDSSKADVKEDTSAKLEFTSKCEQLYKQCLDPPIGTFFSASRLSTFEIAESIELLVKYAVELVRQQKFLVMKDGNVTGWKTRDRDLADR